LTLQGFFAMLKKDFGIKLILNLKKSKSILLIKHN
jgi:hypothetical protein